MATVRTQTAYIYRLIDPRDGTTRYVGQTIDMEQRLKYHIYLSGAGNVAKTIWISDLRSLGIVPVMEEICRCSRDDADKIERMYIEDEFKNGNLFNLRPFGNWRARRKYEQEKLAGKYQHAGHKGAKAVNS